MSDSSIVLNLGAGGDSIDAELLAGATKRERHQVSGALLAEVARVKNTAALATDYSLTVRQVPAVTRAGGYYFASSGTLPTVTAAAQNGTSTGYFWIQNPTANTKNFRLWSFDVQLVLLLATIDHLTAPRLMLSRFTFTGTASGAVQAVAKRKTTDATNTCDVRTASTGMTVTLGNPVWNIIVPDIDVGTVADFTYNKELALKPNTEGEIVDLAPGEGVVLFQLDAGTTGDGRRLSYNGLFDEYS